LQRTPESFFTATPTFKTSSQVNQQADADPHTLRIAVDAKVAVKVGEFDQGGTTRMPTVAVDHDFDATATLTPDGLFLPACNQLYLCFVSSQLTADCTVDMIEPWWEQVKDQFAHIRKLVINQDNGPENHSRRTQFMYRIVAFAHQSQLKLQLASYPPYHSKYNPVERTFGWLEPHWNGSLLDAVDTVLPFAQTLTFKGMHPVVTVVEKLYKTGVKLTQQARAALEQQIQRLPNLPKWFVEITGKLT
jgi:hypothetical protein